MPTSIHVLIVEDEPTMAGWVALTLEPLRVMFPGAKIEVVHSWKEAQQIIYAEPAPTIILLDLLMPDSTLMQTLAQVPGIEERSALLIITGQHRDDVDRGLMGRKVEILQKGADIARPNAIISAITRALERKALLKEQQRFASLAEIIEALHAKGYGTTPQSA